MPTLTIATWNINSVRLRADQVRRFVEEAKPDVVCLQEIKCRNGEFPRRAFKEMGLRYLKIVGQRGWHGVAIASRHRLETAPAPDFCPHAEARVAAVKVKGLTLHNVYVPAGGDLPDPAQNKKFAHKLEVIARMRAHYATMPAEEPCVLVGDLNIAPGAYDVWSHKQLLDVVSHTPVETEGLEAVRSAAGFIDLARMRRPEPEKLFTWWSYRNIDWTRHNRGRRLDHIWATPSVAERCEALDIHVPCRNWERPSDHVPVTARLAL
jgi:exodeoxyribonuclease-3